MRDHTTQHNTCYQRQRNGQRPVEPELLRHHPLLPLRTIPGGEVEEARAENGLREEKIDPRPLAVKLVS
jgi:hypothetical protein